MGTCGSKALKTRGSSRTRSEVAATCSLPRSQSQSRGPMSHRHGDVVSARYSVLSEEFGSCRMAFSEDGDTTPRQHSQNLDQFEAGVHADGTYSDDDSEFGGHVPPSAGCMPMLGGLTQRVQTLTTQTREEAAAVAASHASALSGRDFNAVGGRSSKRRRQPGDKPEPGCSLKKRDMSVSAMDCHGVYEDADGTHYNVRSENYAKTKKKIKSEGSIYKLLAVDMFQTDKKRTHFVKQMNVNHLPIFKHQDPALNTQYPPLLVVNIMLPSYAPSLWGSSDGPGWSIVQYYTLPPEFNPETFPNQKALGLFKRLVQNKKEADATQTRERLKIISRVVNVDEWREKAPLTNSEYKLLSSYNEKPLLTRPQQLFFLGHNYFEIDLDVHQYAYMARNALMSFTNRMDSMIWETAIIVQGNSPDELPEQVLASARMYRVKFTQMRTLSFFQPTLHTNTNGVDILPEVKEAPESSRKDEDESTHKMDTKQ